MEAPEPNAWLPILDLTEELEALDITGELELIALEEGRVDLERELAELESDFWRTAEAEHPFLTGELPIVVVPAAEVPAAESEATVALTAPQPVALEPIADISIADIAVARVLEPVVPVVAPAVVEPAMVVEPEPLPVPAEYARIRPNRPAIAGRRRALRLRRRVIVTALVVVVVAACVGVTAQVIGGTHPRRDVTVSVDGRANTVVTRAGTVRDLLAASGVVVHAGDRVIPPLSTQLRQGMPINIVRSFPIVVDVDGVVAKHRTTRHALAGVRRELGLPAALVRVSARGRLLRNARVVLRTPHAFDFVVDGTTTPLTGVTALTVRELLASREITLGPIDEVKPAIDTTLADGQTVQVVRISPDEVAEDQVIPFRTELRDDATLAAGHTAVVQAGKNGTVRVISTVLKQDGIVVKWTEARRVVMLAPVTEILRRGTKRSGTAPPVAPPATSGGTFFQSGTASWYDSHAGAGACAHLTLPFGTIVKIVNTANGRTAQCRVGDRGPQASTGHIIDLNPDVFQALAPLGTGIISVKLYIL